MTRAQITKWLGDLLKKRIDHKGSYFATEVVINYGKLNTHRIDYLQFEPAGLQEVSGIEKGIFTCYEIKSCRSDYETKFGKNFIGEKNYYVMTMPTYIDLFECGETSLKRPEGIGILVACPLGIPPSVELECPHEPDGSANWELQAIVPGKTRLRQRSMTELLFCMLRSKKEEETE